MLLRYPSARKAYIQRQTHTLDQPGGISVLRNLWDTWRLWKTEKERPMSISLFLLKRNFPNNFNKYLINFFVTAYDNNKSLIRRENQQKSFSCLVVFFTFFVCRRHFKMWRVWILLNFYLSKQVKHIVNNTAKRLLCTNALFC